MKKICVFMMCLTLLGVQFTFGQSQESRTPTYVYAISAGAIVVLGGVWAYRNFVKAPGSPSQKSLAQQALDELQYLGSDADRKALQKLETSDEIHNFMAAFWKKRDPSPGTEMNEAQEEFYSRRDYANVHFGKKGWKTDRGRAYILFGPPDEIERLPMIDYQLNDFNAPSIKALEMWVYLRPATGSEPENIFSSHYAGAAKFVFADFSGSAHFTQIYSSERGEISDSRVYVTGLSQQQQP